MGHLRFPIELKMNHIESRQIYLILLHSPLDKILLEYTPINLKKKKTIKNERPKTICLSIQMCVWIRKDAQEIWRHQMGAFSNRHQPDIPREDTPTSDISIR